MRSDVIANCMLAFRALESRNGVTAAELSEALGLSLRSAYRYIDAASVVAPVIETGTRPARFRIEGKA
jgi:predicted DNA-binding transcriptional regulator YafY